jgi:hypothetical protein
MTGWATQAGGALGRLQGGACSEASRPHLALPDHHLLSGVFDPQHQVGHHVRGWAGLGLGLHLPFQLDVIGAVDGVQALARLCKEPGCTRVPRSCQPESRPQTKANNSRCAPTHRCSTAGTHRWLVPASDVYTQRDCWAPVDTAIVALPSFCCTYSLIRASSALESSHPSMRRSSYLTVWLLRDPSAISASGIGAWRYSTQLTASAQHVRARKWVGRCEQHA